PGTVPERLADRRLYRHNEKQTLVRTTPEENAQLGRIIAGKLNASTGPVAVYLPLRGISVISAEGKPYHWPEADAALFESLRKNQREEIRMNAIGLPINET